MLSYRYLSILRRILWCCLSGLVLYGIYASSYLCDSLQPSEQGVSLDSYIRERSDRKALVVASMQEDDTSWVQDYHSDWEHYVYVADNQSAPLSVPINKGREANVYLTYLIDNYDTLPGYILFMHGQRYQWHNEDPMYDGVPVIQNLRLQHVAQVGFVNTRCTWTLGCPHEIDGLRSGQQSNHETAGAFSTAFTELFPELDLPERIGAPCGAQFAVSRAAVLKRPKTDYIRYRQWLWDTDLEDSVSGRVLEYTWHMMFDKPAEYCLDPAECFCSKYGLCDLACSQEECEKRYHLPQFANIPQGWPDSGEEGTKGWPAKDWHL